MPTIESTFSWGVLLSLLITFLVSSAMFWILVLRDTLWRERLRLSDWADDRGFQLLKAGQMPLPESLSVLAEYGPLMGMALAGGESILLRIQIDPPPMRREQEPAARHTYHILVRQAGGDWRAAALRPAHAMRSLLDYFLLEGFPSVLVPERFLASGSDRRAAATLASSAAVRLLPSDIGLLLIGPIMILDFSARGFDSIEFDRILAICEQLIQQLPATATTR
jgi:hypothetical protein